MNNENRKKIQLIVGLIVLVLAIIMLTLFLINNQAKKVQIPQGKKVIKAEMIVEEGTLKVIGNIQADRYAKLGFMTGGTISRILVKQGDTVSKGDILAELNREKEQLNLDLKLKEWERENFSGTPRRADLLKQEILVLREALNQKKIKAPFSGTVVKIKGGEGENFLTSNNDENWVLILVNRNKMKGIVKIPEQDIQRVKMGQKVTFRFDTLGGEEFIGRVSAISPVGQVVNGYAQMETELLLENPDPRIYPGYSFSASITVSGSRENLTIPREYTRWKDDKIFVSLCNEFGVVMEEKEIKVASLGKEKVLVKEGLNPGQWICLPPPLQAEGNMEMFF